MKLIYLACPFTGSRAQQEARETIATYFAAQLTDRGAVYSPVTHGVRLEAHLPLHKTKSHEFWMGQCMPILEVADELILLPLPGWRESKGVAIELRHADRMRTPISVIDSEYYNCERLAAEELAKKGWEAVCL